MKSATHEDDYYHHIDDSEDVSSDESTKINWANFELEPVKEDEEPSFSDTLSERNRDAFKNLKIVESRNPDEIAFKALVNRYKQNYETFADSSGVAFQVEVEPRGVTADLKMLEKVLNCFTDALFVHECMGAMVVGSHLEDGKFVVRLTGYLGKECQRKPQRVSDALKAKAEKAGMALDWNFQSGQKLEYEVSMELSD